MLDKELKKYRMIDAAGARFLKNFCIIFFEFGAKNLVLLVPNITKTSTKRRNKGLKLKYVVVNLQEKKNGEGRGNNEGGNKCVLTFRRPFS